MSERGWGAYAPLTLATVRHSGSHFALKILERHFLRHSMTEDFRRDTDAHYPPLWFSHTEPAAMGLIRNRMTESGALVLTMRHPMEVARSWIKRDMCMDNWFRAMWRNLFALQGEYNGLWLAVDTHDREERLQAIADALQLDLKTDWRPAGVTGNNHAWRQGMTLDECRAFFKTLPFAQFGYDI